MRRLAFLTGIACALTALTCARIVAAQSADPRGAQVFADRCAPCHGGDGRGGERGPDIVTGNRSASRDAKEIGRVDRRPPLLK